MYEIKLVLSDDNGVYDSFYGDPGSLEDSIDDAAKRALACYSQPSGEFFVGDVSIGHMLNGGIFID